MTGLSSKVAKRFFLWGRNARVLVLTEPFWSLPMSWVFFYRTIFLRESIGLTEVEIGLLFSFYNLLSIVSPLIGGYLADRFGRKRVLMLFDSVAYLSSLTVWAFTQNIWYALLAYMLESLASVIFAVWECLLVEDTSAEHTAGIYAYVSAIYNVGALSTPIAGYIVGLYGVDQGSRLLFTLTFLSLIPMFAIRQAFLRETETGYQIMKERKYAGFRGYLESLSMIKKNRVMAALLFSSIVANFYYATSRYLPLYLIDSRGLGLSEDVASLMPSISSISALMMLSLVVPKITSSSGYVKVLTMG